MFIAFMIEYQLQVFAPSHVDILLYIQLLVNSHKTIGTIKNYLSGAKLFVAERGGDISAFSNHMIANFLKGIARKDTHVPRQAVPIPTSIMLRACSALRSLSQEGEIIAATVLFAFATMLRQCHMFYTPHGYMHIIRRGDLLDKGDVIQVSVRSSKTTGRAHLSIIPVYPVPSGPICPVAAIRRALASVPAGAADPVFISPVTRTPFGAAYANLMLRAALTAVGFAGAQAASFHSLQRSSVQACAKAGLPLDEVKSHGLWRSSAVRSYLPPPLGSTSRALNSRLANEGKCLGAFI